MALTDLVIIGNVLVSFALLVATLYRIKIEKKQVQLTEQSIKSKDKVSYVAALVKAERKEILTMNKRELEHFLNMIERMGTKDE